MHRGIARNIYYLCPCNCEAVGGDKKIYQHVELLNKHGLSAYVLHDRPNFRFKWFENHAPIAYPSRWTHVKTRLYELPIIKRYSQNTRMLLNAPLWTVSENKREILPRISAKDIVVIPEYNAYQVYPQLSHQPFVIFNQRAYGTFNFAPLQGSVKAPYRDEHLLGTFVWSRDNADYLRSAFQKIVLHRLHNSINVDVFQFSRDKKKQIAFMPRKNRNDIAQVISMIRASNQLRDWAFVAIDGMGEKEVAKVLKESAIFLSFSYQEGSPLPPAEAMVCGCIVIGYHGQGAKEYLKPPFAYPIDQGDITSFAETVKKVATDYEANPYFYKKVAMDAHDFILHNFSQEIEEQDFLAGWEQILQKHEERSA